MFLAVYLERYIKVAEVLAVAEVKGVVAVAEVKAVAAVSEVVAEEVVGEDGKVMVAAVVAVPAVAAVAAVPAVAAVAAVSGVSGKPKVVGTRFAGRAIVVHDQDFVAAAMKRGDPINFYKIDADVGRASLAEVTLGEEETVSVDVTPLMAGGKAIGGVASKSDKSG